MVDVAFNKSSDITDVSLRGDTACINIWYPRSRKEKYLCVGLIDVRSADNIRISYDHDRDGWVIEQASIFEWPIDDKVCDSDWQEVAFIKAWAREREVKPGETV